MATIFSLEGKARWYVYELIDPRTGEPFYIGKGSGKRIDAHEREAAKGVCSRKTKRIKDLALIGLAPEKRKVAFFWDEQAAYDHETDVIADVGLENLTNVLPGGQKAWEVRLNERRERVGYVEPLHKMLARPTTEHVFARMATWLKAGGHLGTKFECRSDATGRNIRFICELTEAFYNEVLPRMWRNIVDDAQSHPVVERRLKEYGIEVVHGCA